MEMRTVKKYWFRAYWFIGLLSVIILFLAMLLSDYRMTEFVIAIFTSVFLTQKQKLEETRLFSELFMKFNERYDKLNDKIAGIKSASQNHIQNDTNNILDDYFNLCAEEYLFYKDGRIPDSVWKSWCRGMVEHLKTDVIRRYWDDAQKEGSYYDLTTEIIEKHAK